LRISVLALAYATQQEYLGNLTSLADGCTSTLENSVAGSSLAQARFGDASSFGYRRTFFAANPDVVPSVTAMHHAVEQKSFEAISRFCYAK
jgi:hypothetical protein